MKPPFPEEAPQLIWRNARRMELVSLNPGNETAALSEQVAPARISGRSTPLDYQTLITICS
jgi:hypothetical protein